MEVVAGEPPEELAADVRNIKRYVACQKKVYEWVGWYGEVKKNVEATGGQSSKVHKE